MRVLVWLLAPILLVACDSMGPPVDRAGSTDNEPQRGAALSRGDDPSDDPSDGESGAGAPADGDRNPGDAPPEDRAPYGDDDGDGLVNQVEDSYGSDPTNPDSDGGGVSDGAEVYRFGSNPLDPSDDLGASTDTDRDGVDDLREGIYGTDPANPDSDGGGVGDYAELFVDGTDPLDPADDGTVSWVDDDGDGLPNSEEDAYGTDGNNPDTDGGGLSDYDEIYQWGSNPRDPSDDLAVSTDSDGDGLADYWETQYLGSDPNNPDSDGGGWGDYDELNAGTDPNNPADDGTQAVDSDGDGLYDFWETTYYGTDPNAADTDGGGVSDYDETSRGLDPRDPADDASYDPGTYQSDVDSDGDGLTDDWETTYYGTDPNASDSDGGGVDDYTEIASGTSPLDASDDGQAPVDTDGDGLYDAWETDNYGTDPLAADSDGGGVDDFSELSSGTDPNDADDDGKDPVDTDGDGLYDTWETLYYGTDPDAFDTDGDGVGDYDELVNGTNPTSPEP